MAMRTQSLKATIQREGDGVRLSYRSAFDGDKESFGYTRSKRYVDVSAALQALYSELYLAEDAEDDADREEWEALEEREPTDEELDLIEAEEEDDFDPDDDLGLDDEPSSNEVGDGADF